MAAICGPDKQGKGQGGRQQDPLPGGPAQLTFLAQEKEDISWQTLIFKVPRGVMA